MKNLINSLPGKCSKGNSAKIVGIVAAIVAVGVLLGRRRENGSRLIDDLIEGARDLGERIVEYGARIKDKLIHEANGPNGEDVFSDMYDRHYYIDEDEKRVYLDS